MSNVVLRAGQSLLVLTVLIIATCLLPHHPPRPHTDSPDEEARTLLQSADRVQVIVETARDIGGGGLGVEAVETPVGDFSVERLQPVVKQLNLNADAFEPYWGSDTIPTLFFDFYKDQKEIVSIWLDYGSSPNTIYRNHQKKIYRRLQPQSAFAWRELVVRQPQLVKALIKAGAKAKDLSPQRAFEITDKN